MNSYQLSFSRLFISLPPPVMTHSFPSPVYILSWLFVKWWLRFPLSSYVENSSDREDFRHFSSLRARKRETASYQQPIISIVRSFLPIFFLTFGESGRLSLSVSRRGENVRRGDCGCEEILLIGIVCHCSPLHL